MNTEQLTLSDLDKISSSELEELTRESLENFISQLEVIDERNVKQDMQLLQVRITLLKKELLSPTTTAILSSKSPKKNIFLTWAELLESQHDLEVENKLTPSLESVGMISSYIKREMRVMGVETHMMWVHDSLPHKYKLDFNNSKKEDNDIDNSERCLDSSLNTDYKQENKSLIDLLEKEIKVKQSILSKLRTSHFLALLTEDEQKIVKETYLKSFAIIDIAGDLFDDRVSCPTMLQHILLNAHIQGTDNFAAGIYVEKVKNFGANRWQGAKKLFDKQYKIIEEAQPEIKKLMKILNKLDPKSENYKKSKVNLKAEEFKVKQANLEIKAQKENDTMTSKQTMKVMDRKMKNLLPILEPASRDDAISIGYYGLRCVNCGSFRTYRDTVRGEMKTICLKCEYYDEAKFAGRCRSPACAFPFFDDVVKIMVENVEKEMKKLKKIVDDTQTDSLKSEAEIEKFERLCERYEEMRMTIDSGALPCKCPRCDSPVTFSKKYLPKKVEQ